MSALGSTISFLADAAAVNDNGAANRKQRLSSHRRSAALLLCMLFAPHISIAANDVVGRGAPSPTPARSPVSQIRRTLPDLDGATHEEGGNNGDAAAAEEEEGGNIADAAAAEEEEGGNNADEAAATTAWQRMLQTQSDQGGAGNSGSGRRGQRRTKQDSRSRPANNSTQKSADEEADEEEKLAGTWSSSSKKYLDGLRSDLGKEVYFQRGGGAVRPLKGKWPEWAVGTIPGAPDPSSVLDCTDTGDFTHPNAFFWAPEMQFPHLYPEARPCCPWCKGTACVASDGWVTHPRRCYDEDGNTALIFKKYKCCSREERGEEPRYFRGHDPRVISQAPSVVQMYWRRYGFRITHRGAIRLTLLDSMRSAVVNGLGAQGFMRGLAEQYKASYFYRKFHWDFAVNYRLHKQGCEPLPQANFVDFDSAECDVSVPSLSYMLRYMNEEIEQRIPYYSRKLSMVVGSALSFDHSFKVAKLVQIGGTRAFEGLYCAMNEVGKIAGFWFTNGTSMEEVGGVLRQMAKRYEMVGSDGPEEINTDNCCQERKSWTGMNADGTKEAEPIFPSLARLYRAIIPSRTEEEQTASVGQRLVLKLPQEAVVVDSGAVVTSVAKIWRKLRGEQEKAIGFDCEWTPGTKDGPHLVQIGLDDGSTYLFPVCTYRSFPNALKELIQNKTVLKCGNNISADVSKLREIDVNVQGAVELGSLAHNTGMWPNCRPSLGGLVLKLFGCALIKDDEIRMSRWGSLSSLSPDQKNYAALDAYASVMVYKKLALMPRTSAKNTLPPRPEDLPIGTEIAVYSRDASCTLVGHGIIDSRPSQDGDKIRIKMKPDNIKNKAAKIPYSTGCIQDLLDTPRLDSNLQPMSEVVVMWRVKFLRVPQSRSSIAEVQVQTEMADVLLGSHEDGMPSLDETDDESEGGVDEVFDTSADALFEDEDIEIDLSSDDGSDQSTAGWNPINQDSAHIFIRFSKVIPKGHGCFKPFMARLSDAMFIPDQNDLKFVRQTLKEAGYSEDYINIRGWTYYKSRIRRVRPPPHILERRVKRAVFLYANVRDARTGKPLFSPKARAVYKNVLEHVRKGCLSDKPGKAYYIHIRDDKHGIPVYKCVRGTSALEGFHQKIRQLMRGFNNSPRLTINLLHEYVYRWNHRIDVDILGVSDVYSDYYEGHLIEDNIDLVSSQPVDYSQDAGSDEYYISTTAFEGTGKTFGMIPLVGGAPESFGEDLGEAADNVAAAMRDGDGDLQPDEGWQDVDVSEAALPGAGHDAASNEGTCDGRAASLAVPETSRWMCRFLRTSRPLTNVITTDERKYFEDSYMKFQSSVVGREGDGYGFLNFSLFADAWNKEVWAQVNGEKESTDLNHKNAYHLKSHWKKYKEEANLETTMATIHDENTQLRRDFRQGRVDSSIAAPQASAAESHRPSPTAQEAQPVQMALFAGMGNDPSHGPVAPAAAAAQPAQQTKKRSGRKCGRCGHVASDDAWRRYHFGRKDLPLPPPGKHHNQPADVCIVPAALHVSPEQRKRKR